MIITSLIFIITIAISITIIVIIKKSVVGINLIVN